jgi:PAS domain S-box-containing protein
VGTDPRLGDGVGARSRAPAGDSDELVIRTTPDGGRYTYISPNVRSILGYDPEELLAQPPLQGVHPDDITTAKTTGDRLAAGTDRQTVLLRKRHADGHDVWLETRIASVRDPDTGEVVELTEREPVDDYGALAARTRRTGQRAARRRRRRRRLREPSPHPRPAAVVHQARHHLGP